MNFAKRLLMVAGAVALAGMLSILLTPKAMHAVVSTLVTVVNTSANPALNQDVDNPGRAPFTAQCSANGPASALSTPTCSISAPTGKRIVIENISGEVFFNSGRLSSVAVDSIANGTGARQYVVPTDTGVEYGGFGTSTFNTPTRLYADPGSTLTIVFFAQNNANFAFGVGSVSGYQINP
jgi:hypothetical protein